MGISLALGSVTAIQATPVRRVIDAGLQRVLNRSFVAQIRNDALNGNVSKQQAFRNVEKLCVAGADVNAVDPRTGESAVTVATWFSTPEVVAYLLERGADPNHQDITKFFGRTALHAAATRESTLFTWMLLSFGAQVNVPDKEGRMPIECATDKACG